MGSPSWLGLTGLDYLRPEAASFCPLLGALWGSWRRHRDGCCGCCRCCRPGATGRATRSPSDWRSARGPSGGTSIGCGTWAIRCAPPRVRTAATGWTPAPTSRRCCSTTSRRSPSRSRCRRRPSSVAGIEEGALRALATVRQVMPARLRQRVDALQVTAVPKGREQPKVDTEHLIAIGIGRARPRDPAVRLRRTQLDRRGAAVAAAAPGRAAPPGHLGRPLVPGLLGPGPRRLADLPGGPDDAENPDRTAVLAARAARRRRRELHRFVVPGRRMAVPRASSSCTPRPPRSPPWVRGQAVVEAARPGPLPGARRVLVVGPAGRLGRDVRRRSGGRRAGGAAGRRGAAVAGGMRLRPAS